MTEPATSPQTALVDDLPLVGGAAGDPEHVRAALITNLVLQGVIIVTGGLVRLTGSGLGCPTWPKCTPGSFTPVEQQPQGWHVFVEFGNRLMTFVLAAAALWLFVGAVRRARRLGTPEARNFAKAAFVPGFGIIAQAIVGGVVVLLSLDPRTVSPHFLLSAALVAYSAWLLVRYDEGDGRPMPVVVPRLRTLALVAGCAFALVVLLGTAVTGSGPHSGDADETVRFGFDPLVTSRMHSAAVWLFVACTVAINALCRRSPAPPTRFLKLWTAVLVGAVAEGFLGYVQYFTGLPIAVVALHLAVSAILTALVTLAVLSSRSRLPHVPSASYDEVPGLPLG